VYEHHNEPMLPARMFIRRMALHALLAFLVTGAALGIGILGYRLTEGMPWLDALLNASMILGGMGPVDTLRADAGKWFASFYALFAGMVFLVIAGILVAPVAHRILHWMHLEEEEKETGEQAVE
jgi:hypothetical protein